MIIWINFEKCSRLSFSVFGTPFSTAFQEKSIEQHAWWVAIECDGAETEILNLTNSLIIDIED